jgi:hypothetical protein
MEKFDNLNENERKQLFEQFIAHGGKVVEDKNSPKINSKGSIRPLARNIYKNSETTLEENESDLKKVSKDVIKKEETAEQFEKILNSSRLNFFKHFLISIKNFFAKTTDFSGAKIHIQFRTLTNNIKESLEIIQSISLSVLRSRSFRKVEIAESFFKNFPLFYEIILRFSLLKLDHIFLSMKPTSWANLNVVKPFYINMVKALYPFLGKEEFILNSYKKIYQVIVNLKELDIKTITGKLDVLKKHVELLSFFLRKIEILFPLLISYDIDIHSYAARKILEISPQGVLGGLDFKIKEHFNKLTMEGQQEDLLNDMQENENGEAEQTQSSITESTIEKGLKIIHTINLSRLQESYPDLHFYPKRDKIYLLTLLLDYFTKRYSIILNGRRIRILQTMEQGKRINIQDTFNEFYIEVEKLQRTIKDYTYFIKILEGERNKASLQEENKVAKDQRSQLNSNIRYHIRMAFEKIMAPLEVIVQSIQDYIMESSVPISDSNDKTEFSYFHNQTPEEIIFDFYSFIKATLYLLLDGDFSGPTLSIPQSSTTFRIPQEDDTNQSLSDL